MSYCILCRIILLTVCEQKISSQTQEKRVIGDSVVCYQKLPFLRDNVPQAIVSASIHEVKRIVF